VAKGHSEPRIYNLSEDLFDLVLRIVGTTRPNEAIQLRWFSLIGVSKAGVDILVKSYDLFRQRAHETEVKNIIRSLHPLDFELFSLFFHLLRKHSDHRVLPLDSRIARDQELAMRHRVSVSPTALVTPHHLLTALCCNISACNEAKNYIVQKTKQPLFTGFHGIAWDTDMLEYICTSKKTILVRARNEDKKKAKPRKTNEPRYLELLRRGDTSTLFGYYEKISNLLRLPKGINGSEGDVIQYRRRGQEGEKEGDENQDETSHIFHKRNIRRRENLERTYVKEIVTKLESYTNDLKEHNLPVNQSTLNSLANVPEDVWSQLSERQTRYIEESRAELDSQCKQEERRISRLKTERPCYQMPLMHAPICGYILEKDSNKAKHSSMALTLCPSCASTMDFSIRLSYANGITCSVCDYAERRMMYAPRCFICNKFHLEKITAGQGNADVQKTVHGRLRVLAVIDDCSDHMLRTLRVCDDCWFNWMPFESKFMTLTDIIYAFEHPNVTSLDMSKKTIGTLKSYRREKFYRRSKLKTLLTPKPAIWPSKAFMDIIERKHLQYIPMKSTDTSIDLSVAMKAKMPMPIPPSLPQTKLEKRIRSKMATSNKKITTPNVRARSGGRSSETTNNVGFVVSRVMDMEH
jgi:hypothetical protein